jgi:hypothetical protein
VTDETKPKREGPPQRGLRAIDQARDARATLRFPGPRFWVYTAIVLAAAFVYHYRSVQQRTVSARQALLARQRAVAVELGARWTPLREKVERWSAELAATPGAELIDRATLGSWDFRARPGLYLRTRVTDATSPELLRKAARDSLRDGFTSCFTRARNEQPFDGPPCKRTSDCARGLLCNELDRCAAPAQPYNLRVAYRSLRILSDEWTREVQDANELGLRALTTSFDEATVDDLPIAADLLQRAEYFLLVLDEPTSPEAPANELLAQPHWARVAVVRLADDKLVVRVRREARGAVVGPTGAFDGDTVAARARQANACGLALAVREAMGDSTAEAWVDPQGSSSAAPSANASAAPSAPAPSAAGSGAASASAAAPTTSSAVPRR